MNKRETRSPIKNLPVRQPGQSLREQSLDLFGDVWLPWYLSAFILVFAAIEAWCLYFSHTIWQPVFFTALSIVVVPIAYIKTRRVRKEISLIRTGRLGEEAVGQFLDEKLRPAGYQILHDIPGDGFNVDHIIVGPAGIFTIETKTRSKPIRGDVRIKFDGTTIVIDGFEQDRNPVTQANAQARWLSNLLAEMTSKRFPIKPVVLFPGWFVEMTNPTSELWVLNENALLKFIANEKPRLSQEEVAMITYHLKQYVINWQKNKKP
jgi:hypothetical protein